MMMTRETALTHTTNARLCKGARSKYLHLTNTIWYRRHRQKPIFMLLFYIFLSLVLKSKQKKHQTCGRFDQCSGQQMLTWRTLSAQLVSKTWWRCAFMRTEPTDSLRASVSSPSVRRSALDNVWISCPKRSFMDRRPLSPSHLNKHSIRYSI